MTPILAAGCPLSVVGVYFRRVPMIEVGSDADVACFGNTASHFLSKLGNTILILNDDDRWNRTRTFRLT